MKKIYLLTLMISIGLGISAQKPVTLSQELRNSTKVKTRVADREGYVSTLQQNINPYVHSGKAINEELIGLTYYDLQSNTSAPANRFHRYEDGTMAGVWTRGIDSPGYLDRGTGYNYYNGSSWGEAPETRIETVRTGWPTYAPMGDGEIVIAHHDILGLVVNRRETRGTGDWTQEILAGPTGAADISWPRMVSSGEDNMSIHLLAMTYSIYEGLDLALLYYRSLDGGVTWETEHRILPGMTADDFYGFAGDSYSWAEPKGDTLAFIVSDAWVDLFVMKSYDNGDNWEKVTIWEHPYPMWNNDPADTTYVPDGGAHLAFDNTGKLHVAFGVYRVYMDEGAAGYNYFPFLNGIAYWNEDMPVWSSGDLNELDPDALEESGNLVAWTLDLNNNGELDIIGDYGDYGVGAASMPQITVDDNNNIFLVYSGIIEGFDNGEQQYRHLFARNSPDGLNWGEFVDLNGAFEHMFDECVFPTLANSTDDKLHLIYQADNYPGLSVRGDEDPASENIIYYLNIDKSDLVNTPNIVKESFRVEQNFPNPFNGTTQIGLSVIKTSTVDLKVHDLLGRLVYQTPSTTYGAGKHVIRVNAHNLKNGIYTYTVTVNGMSTTNKMVIQ